MHRLRLPYARAVITAFCLALGASTMTEPSAAQTATTGPSRERTVSVSATGSVAAAPDVAHITTGVVTEGATARDALAKNSTAMAALIAGLKGLGIAAKDIQTTQISVDPRYVQPKDNRPPAINGYSVTNQVHIVQRDLARLGELLDTAVGLGANQLGGIQFEVSAAETLKDDARKKAMDNAIRRARLYAQAAGAQVGEVIAISETMAGLGPRPMHAGRAMMMQAVPVEAGEKSLEVTVHVTWALN